MATLAPVSGSNPSNTLPIAPLPISRMTGYFPMRFEGVMGAGVQRNVKRVAGLR